jgi:hypothetical protein
MKLTFFGIEQLNFVEFNITGNDLDYQKLSSESRFISSEIFNLFAHCFEKSNDLYEYYGPTKYNSRKIVVLRNQLIKNIEKLYKVKDLTKFDAFIDKILLGKAFVKSLQKHDSLWKNKWETYHKSLIEINKEMITIVDGCIESGRILWVIGY